MNVYRKDCSKFEKPYIILRKFVPRCVVNVIHAKVLPGSVLCTLNTESKWKWLMNINWQHWYTAVRLHAYILKARIARFIILQKNLKFPQISSKMPQNGPKMAKNDPKWPKVALIWPKITQNYPKWPKNYPKWPKNDILMSGGTYLEPK